MDDVAGDKAYDSDAWQMTWANQRWTHSIFGLVGMVESFADTWHCSSEWLGAMWPNQWLPHGTPVFVNLVLVSKVLGSTGFEPVTSHYTKAL